MTLEAVVGPGAVAALGAELVLIAIFALGGSRLGGVVLAVLLACLPVGLWAVLLAPRSARRLDLWPRLALKVAHTCPGAVLLATAGLRWWPLLALVAVGAASVVPEVTARP